MRHIFTDWDRISFEIRRSPHCFLFFDYDGTLTHIAPRPDLAKLSPRVRSLLNKLQKNSKFIVAIVSGRSLKNIKKMVGIKGIIYAGNHGMEIGLSSSKVLRPDYISKGPITIIRKIWHQLHKELKHIKGAYVEDKGCTLSVHFRLVKPDQRFLVKKIFTKIVRPYYISKEIRVSQGKMVFEVRPGIDWDKGKVVLYLLKKEKGALPFYIGDDATDKDAFRAIKGRGTSVFVGRPGKAINADYFLRNPREVWEFIARLVKLDTGEH